MADSQEKSPKSSDSESTSLGALLLRLTWMAFGNIVLMICAALVSKGTAPVLTDVLFFATAVGLVVVRYVDITRFGGQTSEGEPATLADWRKYAIGVSIVSLVIWGLAKLAASRGWM